MKSAGHQMAHQNRIVHNAVDNVRMANPSLICKETFARQPDHANIAIAASAAIGALVVLLAVAS